MSSRMECEAMLITLLTASMFSGVPGRRRYVLVKGKVFYDEQAKEQGRGERNR